MKVELDLDTSLTSFVQWLTAFTRKRGRKFQLEDGGLYRLRPARSKKLEVADTYHPHLGGAAALLLRLGSVEVIIPCEHLSAPGGSPAVTHLRKTPGVSQTPGV